jgi:hypothetical protein
MNAGNCAKEHKTGSGGNRWAWCERLSSGTLRTFSVILEGVTRGVRVLQPSIAKPLGNSSSESPIIHDPVVIHTSYRGNESGARPNMYQAVRLDFGIPPKISYLSFEGVSNTYLALKSYSGGALAAWSRLCIASTMRLISSLGTLRAASRPNSWASSTEDSPRPFVIMTIRVMSAAGKWKLYNRWSSSASESDD